MIRDIKIDLEYQEVIPGVPPIYGDIYLRSCTGDSVTIDSWRKKWVKNYKSAKNHFGDFGSKSFGQLHGANRHKPMIVAGSGPSLKTALPELKANSEAVHPVQMISALHNFGLFEDEGFHADYYLSLDSGGVVIDDVSESRNKDGGFYWEKTKGKKLLAYVASDPRLWELWQGEIYLFSCLVPDAEIRAEFKKIDTFNHYISSGGNCGGACLYAAKALMGSNPLIFVGMDQCFGYDNVFHSYATKTYDNPGQYVRWHDVYGNLRKTWPSYLNFKFWMDWVVTTIPGDYWNCSEGLLGAYREGNIAQYKYGSLTKALLPYSSSDTLYLEERNSKGSMCKREIFQLGPFWANPKYEHDLTLF